MSAAELLVAAGYHLDYAGDREGALEMFRRAVSAGGHAEPDARCYLHASLMRAGRLEEARAVAEDVRRSAPDGPDVYVFMGEDHETAGDLQEALRWFSRGVARLQRLDPSGEIWDDPHPALLLSSRTTSTSSPPGSRGSESSYSAPAGCQPSAGPSFVARSVRICR